MRHNKMGTAYKSKLDCGGVLSALSLLGPLLYYSMLSRKFAAFQRGTTKSHLKYQGDIDSDVKYK